MVQVARVTVLLEDWMCWRTGVLRSGNGHLHARRNKRKEPTMPKIADEAGGNVGDPSMFSQKLDKKKIWS